MIDNGLNIFGEKLKEVSGVERVIYHPRVPKDLAGFKEIYGTDINCIIVTYNSVKMNKSVTSSIGASQWYDITCKCRIILTYKDHEDYEQSSQFVFDEILEKLLSKFVRVKVETIDNVDKIIIPELEEITMPSDGLIESVELDQLVHYAEFEMVVSFIF